MKRTIDGSDVAAQALASAARYDLLMGVVATHELHARRAEVLELSPSVLARALEPLPKSIRTLDGLHLATLDFAQRGLGTVQFACLDLRQRDCARAMGFEVLDL